jgi:hypothetical protein
LIQVSSMNTSLCGSTFIWWASIPTSAISSEKPCKVNGLAAILARSQSAAGPDRVLRW